MSLRASSPPGNALELGGDDSHPVWKRLEAAVAELNDATDEAANLMEGLHEQLEGMRYD